MQFLFLGAAAAVIAIPVYGVFLRALPLLARTVADNPSRTAEHDQPTPVRRARSRGQILLRGAPLLAIAIAAVAVVARSGSEPARVPAAQPRIAVTTNLPPAPQLPPPIPLNATAQFGGAGSLLTMNDPRDVAIDASGKVYIADAGNHRIIVVGPDGAPQRQFPNPGLDTMKEPSAVVALKDGLAVLDSDAGALHRYDLQANLVQSFEKDRALFRPRGLATDPQGNIYVADTGHNRVVRVAPDGSSAEVAVSGAQLDQPSAVALDEQGNLYVAEPDSGRIDKITSDGQPGGQWYLPKGSTVTGPHLLWLPGRGLLASVPDQDVLYLYGPTGAIVQSWTVAPSPASPHGPMGLALGATPNDLWVLFRLSGHVAKLTMP